MKLSQENKITISLFIWTLVIMIVVFGGLEILYQLKH